MKQYRRGNLAVAPDVAKALELPTSGGNRFNEVDRFRCVICELDGQIDHGDDASLVLIQYSDQRVGRIAHARCSPSRILRVNRKAQLAPGSDLDVVSLAACMPGPGDGRTVSVLFLDRSDSAGVLTPEGGFLDFWFQGLLKDHWELYLGRMDTLPVLVPGYQLKFDERSGRGEISSPIGALLDRLPTVPTQWFSTARKNGYIVVFAGSLRLHRLHHGATVEAVMQLLDDARVRGEVVTARVPVETGEPRAKNLSAELAEKLDEAIHSTRPGDGSPLDEVPLLVPYQVPPRLLVAMYAGTPTLIVDLNDEDDSRARQTLKSFQRAGLAIVVEGQVWKKMPTGWGAILWPTQALVQTPTVAGEARHALFAEYDSVEEGLAWYRQAKDHGSVFLMVTNLKGRPLSESAISNRTRRGRVLGGAMVSMGAL